MCLVLPEIFRQSEELKGEKKERKKEREKERKKYEERKKEKKATKNIPQCVRCSQKNEGISFGHN